MSNEVDVLKEDNFQHALKVATTLAKSTIIPMQFRNKPEDVFATLALGAELGFKPMQALNSIVMIQGSATLKAQTMLAVAKGKIPELGVSIVETIDSVAVTITRGKNEFTSTWNDAKANSMGLLGKDNYKKQKLTMYRWRAISEALKITCSDVLMGINSTEELSDIDLSQPKMVDITPPSIENFNLLVEKLKLIKDGEARLIKHINDKDKCSNTIIDELTNAQVEYALNFLKQFENTKTSVPVEVVNE